MQVSLGWDDGRLFYIKSPTDSTGLVQADIPEELLERFAAAQDALRKLEKQIWQEATKDAPRSR